MRAGDRALTWHQRVYQSLLVLYPPSFRREWGPAMVQLFCDQLRHPRRPGRAVGLRVWLRTLDDLLSSVPRQQWEAFMEQTSTITRAVIVTSVVAIVAALGTGLAVVAAGIGPAIPVAIVLAVVVVIYRHQLRRFVTQRQGLWYRLLLAGIGLAAGGYLAGIA
jgi:F0F1-type ATP synthase membrane subunit c/vacuolar-type H+-ATPase subunit K